MVITVNIPKMYYRKLTEKNSLSFLPVSFLASLEYEFAARNSLCCDFIVILFFTGCGRVGLILHAARRDAITSLGANIYYQRES